MTADRNTPTEAATLVRPLCSSARQAGLVLILTILPASISSQDLPEPIRVRAAADLGRYHRMVDAYTAGNSRRAVEQLAKWPLERVKLALTRAHTADDPLKPWDQRRYHRASMLHADVALSAAGRVDSPPAIAHLYIASGMLKSALGAGHPSTRHFASRWFQVVALLLRNEDAPFIAAELLSYARKWLAPDPVVLYESAALAESLATDYALARLESGRWSARAETTALHMQMERRQRHLNEAARWLETALEADPLYDVARLRLGRVEALRSQDAKALRTLQPLLTHREESIAYLAALFSGAVHERAGRLVEAAAAYRMALAKVPFGHAARVALSAVSERLGDLQAAQRLIAELSMTPRGAVLDPRWGYQIPSETDVRRGLEILRHEAWQ